jgi:hypothetical protein
VPATLEQVAEWASVLTGENRVGKHYYYVTEPVKRLEWKLKNLKGQLIALTGLQGTGKTSALNYIDGMLWKEDVDVMVIKWTKDWFEKLLSYDVIQDFVNPYLDNACHGLLEAYGHSRKRHPLLGRVPHLGDVSDEGFESIIERADFRHALIIGKGEVKRITEEAVWKYFKQRCSVILIDLPDYTKTDRRLMTKDLLGVQGFWEKIGSNKNIVIAIQKELFGGHFLFGKMTTIELKPLKPEEFLYVFKTQFPDCNLITDDALLLLGQLSRGIFRRFLKYLSLTVEKFAISGQEPPIDIDDVNSAITIEQIMEDMELELYDLFKDTNQRRCAVELLNYLRTKESANQKEIAEFLGVSLATAGKIVSRMFRYVKRDRGKGKEWLISLKV